MEGVRRANLPQPDAILSTSTSSTSSTSSISNSNRAEQHAAAMGAEAVISTVDVDEIVEKNKCAPIYHQLEECLADTDRNWLKCQKEVKALRACSEGPTKN